MKILLSRPFKSTIDWNWGCVERTMDNWKELWSRYAKKTSQVAMFYIFIVRYRDFANFWVNTIKAVCMWICGYTSELLKGFENWNTHTQNYKYNTVIVLHIIQEPIAEWDCQSAKTLSFTLCFSPFLYSIKIDDSAYWVIRIATQVPSYGVT